MMELIKCVSRQVVVACCLVMAATGVARGQSNTTGAINGVVRDASSGESLVGVTVVATSPNLQGAQSEITGSDGSYKIDNLPPGTYLVTFYYSTVQVVRRDIRVTLTRVTRVDQAVDTEDGAGEVIVIDAKAPSIDITRTDEGIALDQDYLEHIPVPGRTFNAALGAAAGSFGDGRGVGFSGSTSLENSYVIDGVNTTALRAGDIGTPLMNEFIDEIHIMTGGYQPEFGRATGAVVNVITKSGTNEFHGSVFSTITPYVRPRQRIFQETSAIDSDIKLDYLADFGVELGGPIVKDKVWFYVGFAPRLLRQNVARFVKRRQDCHTILDDGALSECRAEYQDGLPDENPNSGLLVFEEIDRNEFKITQQQYQFVTKVNFAFGPEHQGAVSVLGSPVSGDGIFGVFGTADATRADFTSLNTDIAAKWTTKLNDNKTQVEALFGWHRSKYDQDAIDQSLNDVQGIRVFQSDLGKYGRAGGESDKVIAGCADAGGGDPYPGIENCPVYQYWLYSPGFIIDDLEDRKSASLKVTQRGDMAGHHELKTGIDVENNVIYEVRRLNGGQINLHLPAERVNQVERFVSAARDGSAPDVCGFATGGDGATDLDSPNRCTYLDELPKDNNTFNWAAFVQDSWSLRPNLTVNYGVRYEEQRLRYADRIRGTVNPFTMEPLGTNALVLRNLWAPRVGAIYDWTREGRSKIYGSFGRFYESIPMSINEWALSGDGYYRADWDFDQCGENNVSWDGDPSLAAPHPGNCPSRVTRDNPPGAGDWYYGDVMLVAPGTKGQYLDEMVVGVQYELLEDLRLGAAAKRRSLGRVIEDISIDAAETYILGNPGPDGFDEGEERALEDRIAELPEGDEERERLETRLEQYRGLRRFDKPRRDYMALELTAVKRFSHNFFVQGSYTLSSTRGDYPGLFAIDSGQAIPNISAQYDLFELMPNRDGPLPQDRTHQLKLDGYHTWDFGTGGVVTTGVRFRAESGTPVDALGGHYLYSADGAYLLPRGAFGRTEFVTGTDFHLSYGRRLAAGYELRVFADVFNLFNQEQTAMVDESYTHDAANPIVGGEHEDLVYLKAVERRTGGETSDPVTRNRNFGNTSSRYVSQSIQFGARLSF